MPIRVTVLGSTGSIGRSAMEVIRRYRDRFEVVGLATHANVDLLSEQIREFSPKHVAVAQPEAARALASRGLGIDVMEGLSGLEALAQEPVDVVLCAVVGAAGLRPVLAAIDAGNRIALANKEPLVMAGPLIMGAAHRRGVAVTPVDSEHNAIFQCLHGHKKEDVHRIHLTASGGPFYGRPRASLADVTPEEAAKHPRWDMGVKISVDSATLMNKGLEVIEAMWLFDVPLEKVQVIIHPQSIVHSMVEFTDGSILAHLGLTDMKFPILFALTWPERYETPMGRLDLTRMRELTFAAPDFTEFPCLQYAFDAARAGGTAPSILNAANEAAVAAFCQHRIGFLDIASVVHDTLAACASTQDVTLDSVIEADAQARRQAETLIAAVH